MKAEDDEFLHMNLGIIRKENISNDEENRESDEQKCFAIIPALFR